MCFHLVHYLFSLDVLYKDELPATHKAKVLERHILDTWSRDVRKRTKRKGNGGRRDSDSLIA